MAELDSISARAAAAELETLRLHALRQGVEHVSVTTLANRIVELRTYARDRDEATEANLRRVMQVDRDRNYGIGEVDG